MPLTATEKLGASFPIPDSPDGRREILSDRAKLTEIRDAHGEHGFALLVEAMVEAHNSADGGKVKAEEDEQLLVQAEQAFARLARENGVAVEGKPNLNPAALDATLAGTDKRGRRGRGDYVGPGANVEDIYQGQWGNTIRAAIASVDEQKGAMWADVRDLQAMAAKGLDIQAAYSSHIGPSGGFLMPESFRNDLLQIAHESAITRPRATVIPMSTPKVTIPAIHETSRASNLFGGVQMYWTEEDADSTESEAQFKTVSLEPDTLVGYAEIPNETMQDTVASSAYFDATFPAAMAFEEDDAFAQGSGVGQPLGWLNAAAMIEVAAESGQGSGTIVYENLLEMFSRLPASSMGRAVWVANQDTLRELGTMALSVGTGGAPVWVMTAQPGVPATILGRPILFSEKMNAKGTAGDIALVDLSFYLIGDLQTVTVESSRDYKFKQRRTAFSIVERVDGQPWVSEAVTPRRGTNNLSPFVSIATRP